MISTIALSDQGGDFSAQYWLGLVNVADEDWKGS